MKLVLQLEILLTTCSLYLYSPQVIVCLATKSNIIDTFVRLRTNIPVRAKSGVVSCKEKRPSIGLSIPTNLLNPNIDRMTPRKAILLPKINEGDINTTEGRGHVVFLF